MIDTIDNIKQLGGITGTDYDLVLTQIAEGVDVAIKKYLGINPEEHTVTGEDYILDGMTKILVLNEYPVSNLTITYDGDTVSTDAYSVDSDNGIVIFNYAVGASVNKLKCSYTAGWSTVPADIRLAFDKCVLDVFNTRNSHGSVQAEKMGDYSVTYGKVIDEALSSYKDILDSYVRVQA